MTVNCHIWKMRSDILNDFILFYFVYRYLKRSKKYKIMPRKYWVHPLWQERKKYGSYSTLVNELKKYPDKFKNYCRLTIDEFYKLESMLKNNLLKTSNRECLPPGLRLMVTLR